MRRGGRGRRDHTEVMDRSHTHTNTDIGIIQVRNRSQDVQDRIAHTQVRNISHSASRPVGVRVGWLGAPG